MSPTPAFQKTFHFLRLSQLTFHPSSEEHPLRELKTYAQATLGMAALGTTVVAAFLLLAWMMAAALSFKTLSWPPVPGQVTRAFVLPVACGNRNHSADLDYQYHFGGGAYTGHALGGDSRFHFFYADCGVAAMEKLAPTFTASNQRPTTVYVNPERPSQAVLIRGVPPFIKPLKWLLLSMVLWGTVYVLRTWA